MTGRAKKEKAFSRLREFVTSSVPADQAWDEALSVVERGADLRAKSKARLADAHAARAQAESQAVSATRDYCAQQRVEADQYLLEAKLKLSEAEQVKESAEKRAVELEQEVQFRLEDASKKRQTAREYAQKLEDTARIAAEAFMEQTRGGAEELANRMREQTDEEIRKILTDLEVARAAAEDELEAQRLLTEAARMRVRSSKFETDSFDDFKQQAA